MVILKPWEKYNGGWHAACRALYELPCNRSIGIEMVRSGYDLAFSSRIYYSAIYRHSQYHYWRFTLDNNRWWAGKEVSWDRYVSFEQCKEAADKALAATNAYYLTHSDEEIEKIALLD